MKKRIQTLLINLGIYVLLISNVSAQDIIESSHNLDHRSIDLETNKIVSTKKNKDIKLGENIKIEPSIHLNIAVGDAENLDPADLASGGHDPNRSGITIQGLETNLSIYGWDWLQGFIAYNTFLDLDDEIDGEWEEIFAKITNLPQIFNTNIELRGGRYLNRFGFHNADHLHSWSTIDTNLVNSRFLGEEGLQSIGGEITFLNNLGLQWRSALSISGGGTVSHDHSHAHGEHGGEEHGEEAEIEAEAAFFDSHVVTANWLTQYHYNDFHRIQTTLSGAWGENEFGENSQIYGFGIEYQWRENGHKAGGKHFRWRTEAMYRHFDANAHHSHIDEEEHHAEEEHHDEHHAEEDDHHAESKEDEHHDEKVSIASLDEFGIYSLISFGLNDNFEVYLRGEYVSGISEAGLDERYRISPGITYFLNKDRNAHVRLQYNYDHSNDFGSEHSAWLQFGINWGGSEVR